MGFKLGVPPGQPPSLAIVHLFLSLTRPVARLFKRGVYVYRVRVLVRGMHVQMLTFMQTYTKILDKVE